MVIGASSPIPQPLPQQHVFHVWQLTIVLPTTPVIKMVPRNVSQDGLVPTVISWFPTLLQIVPTMIVSIVSDSINNLFLYSSKHYSKCSKISYTFTFCSQRKCGLSGLELKKYL